MFESTPKGQTFLSAALGTVASVMKAHATGGTSARIAVMLMGTEKAKNENAFDNVFLLHPLAPTSPEVIRSLLVSWGSCCPGA